MQPASPSNNWHYNKHLKTFARIMRNQSTPMEVRLWVHLLRKGKMMGYTFNRQRPVLKYIVDFMCKKAMLVIEVDGNSHHDPEIIRKDHRKTHDLEAVGFTVLRFTDQEVAKELPLVKYTIERYLNDWRKKG